MKALTAIRSSPLPFFAIGAVGSALTISDGTEHPVFWGFMLGLNVGMAFVTAVMVLASWLTSE